MRKQPKICTEQEHDFHEMKYFYGALDAARRFLEIVSKIKTRINNFQ